MCAMLLQGGQERLGQVTPVAPGVEVVQCMVAVIVRTVVVVTRDAVVSAGVCPFISVLRHKHMLAPAMQRCTFLISTVNLV